MQDLLDKLAAIETEKTHLEVKLREATQAAKTALVEDLRATIRTAGFEIPEIARLLLGTNSNATNSNATKRNPSSGARWALNTDPTKVYTRGPTPSWMKQAMASTGLNASKDQRLQFMAEHMTRA